MLRTARILATVIAVLTMAACGGGSASDRPSACRPYTGESPLPSGAAKCRVEARVSIEVTGAERFEHAGTSGLVINELFRGVLPRETWFANLGMEVPVDYAEFEKYRFRFDVAPGTYRGPGEYRLTRERPSLRGLESPLTDKVALEITSLTETRIGAFVYDRLEEPCTLTIRERLEAGSLNCSKLADGEGNIVTLSVRWAPATDSSPSPRA